MPIHKTGKNSSIEKDISVDARPLDYLLLLILPIGAFAASYTAGENHIDFLLWWGVLFLFGIAAFPLCVRLFPSFSGKGYGFSKSLSILCISFFIWTFTHVGFIPFTRRSIFLFSLIFALFSWMFPSNRKQALCALRQHETIYIVVFQELIFVFCLAAMILIKRANLNINGEEKFMDFAFLNSLVRTDSLPAPDPWLAGKSINYYYFGQFIFAFLTKTSGIQTGVSYTLSICTCFALIFLLAYTLGSAFIKHVKTSEGSVSTILQVGAGLLSGIAVTLWGNSHAFFYNEKSIGNQFLYFLNMFGVNVGKTGVLGINPGDAPSNFFYPNSTRFIGHNPDSALLTGQADYTIHEFPIYSYLIGDLHAHIISPIIVLLILGILFSLYVSKPAKHTFSGPVSNIEGNDSKYHILTDLKKNSLFLIKISICGFLLGMTLMCNYWDFAIYFLMFAMTIWIYNIKSTTNFSIASILSFLFTVTGILVVYLSFSDNPILHLALQSLILFFSFALRIFFPNAFSYTGTGLSYVFTLAHLAALPFNINFQMISNNIRLTDRHTSLFQFLLVWGTHLIFVFVLLFRVIFCEKTVHSEQADAPQENKFVSFFSSRNRVDIFLCGMGIVGLILLFIPEFVYVEDIYGDAYQRANTMFKFTYAAFIILSFVMIYCFIRYCIYLKDWLHEKARKEPFRRRMRQLAFKSFALVYMLFLLFIPAHYPKPALTQRGDNASQRNKTGIDGTLYLSSHNSPQIPAKDSGDLIPYQNAIHWLNQNVEEQVVICEAYGLSYSDYSIVSSYTGLPSIIGWDTHEKLWRLQAAPENFDHMAADDEFSNELTDLVTTRQHDVRNIYETESKEAAWQLLEKYDVRYLIVGDLERTTFFGIREDILRELGDIAYEELDLYIVKIT